MKVYRLHKGIFSRGEWWPAGGDGGVLYRTLAAAQAALPNQLIWGKRERCRQWESDRMDIITEERVR